MNERNIPIRNDKGPAVNNRRAFVLKDALATAYFPTNSSAVSSAMEGLTSVFGMGTGVPPPPWSPGQICPEYKE